MKHLAAFFLFLIVLSQFAKAQGPLKYSKTQVADDIAIFMRNAADIHPNLYHDISAKQLDKKVDSLIKKLPDTLSIIMAYRAFAEATAFINEGHTGLNIPNSISRGTQSRNV